MDQYFAVLDYLSSSKTANKELQRSRIFMLRDGVAPADPFQNCMPRHASGPHPVSHICWSPRCTACMVIPAGFGLSKTPSPTYGGIGPPSAWAAAAPSAVHFRKLQPSSRLSCVVDRSHSTHAASNTGRGTAVLVPVQPYLGTAVYVLKFST